MALVAHEMAKEAAGEATAPLDPPAVKVRHAPSAPQPGGFGWDCTTSDSSR
jgi:hypothetical protein